MGALGSIGNADAHALAGEKLFWVSQPFVQILFIPDHGGAFECRRVNKAGGSASTTAKDAFVRRSDAVVVY